jgi:hypothetical protein
MFSRGSLGSKEKSELKDFHLIAPCPLLKA